MQTYQVVSSDPVAFPLPIYNIMTNYDLFQLVSSY